MQQIEWTKLKGTISRLKYVSLGSHFGQKEEKKEGNNGQITLACVGQLFWTPFNLMVV